MADIDTEKLNERKEMVRKSDELITNLSRRKDQVIKLLEEEGDSNNWEMIKHTSLNSDMSGRISANSALKTKRAAAEEVLQQFSEDLVAIRTKVTMILSTLNEPEESMFSTDPMSPPTPAMKFI